MPRRWNTLTLRKKNKSYSEQDVCRMLLWIYTSEGRYDAASVIEVFEVLPLPGAGDSIRQDSRRW